jgi:hypothetical protein
MLVFIPILIAQMSWMPGQIEINPSKPDRKTISVGNGVNKLLDLIL